MRVNYPGHPLLLVAYDGHSPAIRRWLTDLPRTELLASDRFRLPIDGFPAGPVDSTLVYRRYVLWGEDFQHFDTILGLDTDTLILKSLDGLFLRDDFFAVANHCPYEEVRVFGTDQSRDAALISRLAEDDIPYPFDADDMINAGVFVLPRAWRSRIEQDKLIDITRRYAPWLAYADQSAISLWMRHHQIPIAHTYAYNLQARLLHERDVSLSLDDAAIVHFSDIKPGEPGFRQWHDIRGYADALEELFTTYRDRTPAA